MTFEELQDGASDLANRLRDAQGIASRLAHGSSVLTLIARCVGPAPYYDHPDSLITLRAMQLIIDREGRVSFQGTIAILARIPGPMAALIKQCCIHMGQWGHEPSSPPETTWRQEILAYNARSVEWL